MQLFTFSIFEKAYPNNGRKDWAESLFSSHSLCSLGEQLEDIRGRVFVELNLR